MAETRKVSVVIPLEYYQKMSDENLTPTEGINTAVEFYYENRDAIEKERIRIEELIVQNREQEHKILMLNSQLFDAEEHIKTLKQVIATADKNLDAANRNFENHVLQTQTLINKIQLENSLESKNSSVLGRIKQYFSSK